MEKDLNKLDSFLQQHEDHSSGQMKYLLLMFHEKLFLENHSLKL